MIFSDPDQKSAPPSIYYEFGQFHLIPGKRLLTRAGEQLPLTSKAFDTLLVLVENRHQVVEKEVLLMRVWGGRLVAENNLNQKIAQLRRVLGETPQHHRYIVTIPGQGYQFVASVREVSCDEEVLPILPRKSGQAPQAVPTQRRQRCRQRWTIAVLPFEVLGAQEHEYLGLCLADALITRLSKLELPGLVVVPATNTFPKQADGSESSVEGKRPAVAFVLNGRIRKFDQRIRITAQFLGVEEGITLWAEQFDETLTDWLQLEDKIASQITDALYLKIKRGQFDTSPDWPNDGPNAGENAGQNAVGQADTTSESEAHRLYLKGQYFCDKRTPEGVKKGMDYFTRSIECDPRLALAYAGLAQGHMMLGFYEQRPQRETIPLAEEAAAEALALDASLPEAHVTMALAQMGYYFNWDAAKAEFDVALAAKPSYAIGHQWYGYLLTAQGRFDQALKEIALAQQLDPLSLVIHASTGLLLYLACRYDEAVTALQHTIEMDHYPLAHLYLGFVYEQQGRFEEAIAEMVQAAAHYSDSSLLTASFIHAYARAGQHGEARRLLAQLHQQVQTRYVPPYYLALAYTGLGETDEAFDWLQKAYVDRSLWLLFLKVDPRLNSLRDDSRFAELLKKMKLDQ